MMFILAVWAITFVICIGLGLLTTHTLKNRRQSVENRLLCFWIGFAAMIFLLQIWHLFLKVDWKAFLFISLFALAGLIVHRKDLRLWGSQVPGQRCVHFALLAAGAILIANRAVDQPCNYDAGLYYLNSINWLNTSAIVPGLGNLEGRLAFNSSYFLYVTLLRLFDHDSYHFANGLLLLVVIAQSYFALVSLTASHTKYSLHNVVFAFTLPVLIYKILYHVYRCDVPSPTPDLPVFILGILVSVCLLSLLEKVFTCDPDLPFLFAVILILSALGIVIKMSFLVFGVFSTLLAAGVFLFRPTHTGIAFAFEPMKVIVALVVVGLATWFFSNIILSGYLLYPSTLLGVSTEWTMPNIDVIDVMNEIRSWARTPYVHWALVLGNGAWFRPWLQRLLQTREVTPMCLCLVSLASLPFLKKLHTSDQSKDRWLWLALLPAVSTLCYWFITAPRPRFAGSSFCIMGIGSFVLTFHRFVDVRRIRLGLSFLCILLILSSCVQGAARCARVALEERDMIKALAQVSVTNIVFKGNGRYGFHPTQSTPLTEMELSSGLKIFVPQSGNQCWDAPLPCTPYPNNDLRLRKSGDLSSGFAVSSVTSLKKYIEISDVYYSNHRYQDCISTLKEALALKLDSVDAIKVKPYLAITYNNICISHIGLGQWQEAIPACEKALAINPDFASARNNLAFARSHNQVNMGK